MRENIPYEKYLADKFEAECRKLKNSGYDLSKINIVMEHGHKGTYITQHILEDLKNYKI